MMGKENITAYVKGTVELEIGYEEAFRVLCKALDMDFILTTDNIYDIKVKEVDDEKLVYLNGKCIDERGDLFLGLLKVAENIFPNLS